MNPVICLVTIIATILIILPSTSAWNSGIGDTHDNIASKLYHSTPAHIQKHLDLKEMKKGARWPDYNGESKKWHGYPLSVIRVNTYLKKAKNAYLNKNYKMESFYYGVMSHYISDTYAAPHTVKRLSFHTKYYAQGDRSGIKNYKIRYSSPTMMLKYGYFEGQKSAGEWEKRSLWKFRTTSVVQNDLNRAFSATLSIYRQCVGF
jgi:hypothetical protein